MTEFDRTKLEFVKALPEATLDLLAEVVGCPKKGSDRCQQLANARPIVSMALLHGVFNSGDLRRLASAVGADTTACGSDHALAEAIYAHMTELKIRSELGEDYPEFVEFMKSIKQSIEPVCLLTSLPTAEAASEIVGYFNAAADFETEWLVVDLSIHPDVAVRERGVLLLRLDDYERGSVQWLDSLADRGPEGWLPMYAATHTELPSLDLEEECESDFSIDFPDERYLEHYETLASWSNLMTRPGVLCRSGREQPPRVFAQLGGRPYPWVEQPDGRPDGCSVLLRTHANSEPWVEVSLCPNGQVFVDPHIT